MQKEAKRVLDEARADVSGERCLLRVLDTLTETESLSLAQHLMTGLEDMAQTALFSRVLLLQNTSRVASIPTLSDEKAEFVGYRLASIAFTLWVEDVAAHVDIEKALSRAWQGHPMILTGLVAFVEETLVDTSDRTALLACFQQVLQRTLAGTTPPLVKQTALAAIVRMGWVVDDESHRVTVIRVLVEAARILPLADSATTISSIVLGAVDLATSVHDPLACHVDLASLLLSLLPHVQDLRRGSLHLLLALESLIKTAPSVVWELDTDLLPLLAFLLASIESPVEQGILLRLLHRALEACPITGTRAVYAEALFPALLALLPHSSSHLALVEAIATRIPLAASSSATRRPRTMNKHWPLVHLVSTLVHDPAACTAWLDASATALVTTPEAFVYDSAVVLVCCALLFHPAAAVQAAAIVLAKTCILAWPVAGRLVVPCVVYVLARPGQAPEQLLELLHVLIATAKDSECMKTILKTIKALADVPDTKALALRLLYHVWTLESRVYPRLEEMLSVDAPPDDLNWQICQLYTIYELCQVRGDLGLNFVARIQGALEHALPSMAAMALACVRALCVGDCLDFAAACKIIATKLRKKKIAVVDHPLYQEELCALYGIGGTLQVSDKPAFMDQLWAFTTSDRPAIRLAAWTALNQYPLHLIGLKLVSAVDINVEPQESDEAELERAIDQLLAAVVAEPDADVRVVLDALLQRVGADEAKQPRKRFVAERTSGGATREMRNLLPTFPSLRQMYRDTVPLGLRQALAGAVLHAFVHTAPDESLRKRKDKFVKHMEGLCDDANALRGQLVEDAAAAPGEWPLQLALLTGWDHFMHQYMSLRQDKEALVKDGDEDALERVALQLVATYDGQSPNDHLALGAVARFLPSELHVLANRMVEQLLRALSLTQAKHQSSIIQETDGPRAAILALGMATQGPLGLHENRVEEVAEKILGLLLSSDARDAVYAPSCLLALGHVVQSLMLKQNAAELMARLWHTLLDQLLACTVVDAPGAASQSAPPRATGLVARADPNKAKLPAVLSALAMASEGCMAVQAPQWLDGLRLLLLDLVQLGYSEAFLALPPVLLQCLHYELIGWTEVDAFVSHCLAAITTQPLAAPEALAALPYLLCRTQPLGHTLAPADLPRTLVDRLETIAKDADRVFDATARSFATLGLANLLGVGLAIDARATEWKGLLVGRADAERAIQCLTHLAALCPLQRVRVHAAWSLGALSALGTASDSFQIKNQGMDAGLQLASTTLTYKLLDRLRQLKHPSHGDAMWVASAFTGLTPCQIPTFHYATMVQRHLKARLGDAVATAALGFSFHHCVQDPSLLSFLLEMTDGPRFRQLSRPLQAYFYAHVAALAKLVAPNQLHKILSNLNHTPASLELFLGAVTGAAAVAAASPSAVAVCASILLDDVFPRLATASLDTLTMFAKAISVVDRKQGKTRFVEALKTPAGYAACVCLMELFRLGGIEPREVRAALPFLAACSDRVELLILHIASCLGRLQPNDQLLWLKDLINWVGLSIDGRSATTAADVVLLQPLLAALCVIWSPNAATKGQWLFLGHPTYVRAATDVLHASFVEVLLKLKATVDSKASLDLLGQVLVLVEQGPTSGVYDHILTYAYAIEGLRLGNGELVGHFSNP
ncbi:Aste57867_20216 [Aphanomyces stellatus]|uniref:Aste57867_20216 protein n=1 Tax=Aphanomyces stellatus TaxID=120398 RepID=A0A485LEM2_9STRA|nr:hypothetical protein As57867_020150 [Aphanomyces stellatus]VFT96909.1 Aste57867_20216 [Aphanomyces stellatus]